MRLNRPSLLAGLALILAGCGTAEAGPVADTSPAAPSTTSTLSASSSSRGPQCAGASSAAIKAINERVQAKGGGNSVTSAVVWADPNADAWWIVGAFDGPAGEGEAALGSWATTKDPTSGTFDGPVYAIDGGARSFSDAPPNTVVEYDPTKVPALGCWNRLNH